MGFSRQEYWSGLSFPPPRDLYDSGIIPVSFVSPALTGGFFTTQIQALLKMGEGPQEIPRESCGYLTCSLLYLLCRTPASWWWQSELIPASNSSNPFIVILICGQKEFRMGGKTAAACSLLWLSLCLLVETFPLCSLGSLDPPSKVLGWNHRFLCESLVRGWWVKSLLLPHFCFGIHIPYHWGLSTVWWLLVLNTCCLLKHRTLASWAVTSQPAS